jgi:death-on-curing protein
LANEPRWLNAWHVTHLNARIVADTGEPHFVRDRGLLESALARPHNAWAYGEEEIVPLAVTLLLGLALNHPFGQGNKRTAYEAADIFLFINGWDLALADRPATADLIIDVITGAAEEADLLELFDKAVRPRK